MAAQSLHVPLTYVHAIDQDGASLDIIEAVQQFADSGFPRTSSADESNLLAWCDAERYVTQHPVLTFVREPHAVEDNTALHLCGLMRLGWRGNSHWRIEQLKDALNCGHG